MDELPALLLSLKSRILDSLQPFTSAGVSTALWFLFVEGFLSKNESSDFCVSLERK